LRKTAARRGAQDDDLHCRAGTQEGARRYASAFAASHSPAASDLLQRLAIYMVISNPKRRSENSGLVHFMAVSLHGKYERIERSLAITLILHVSQLPYWAKPVH
jgi:hypothetical protein